MKKCPRKKKKKKLGQREREGGEKKNAKEPMKSMSTFLNRKTLHDF